MSVETVEASDGVQVFESFDDMGLKENLLRGIYGMGFDRPSEIQKRAVVPFKQGRDLLAQAQSGTGKTATFSVGVLSNVDIARREVQALLLAPARELAEQIADVITKVGKHMGVEVALCIGGRSAQQDMARLSSGVHVVVGTPGRVQDLISRRALRTESIRMFVLDEADEMLSQGFKEQIYEIFKFLPDDVQVGLFSATMPQEVIDITEKFLRNPVRILVKKEQLTLEGIRQFYVGIEREEWKFDVLCDLYDKLRIAQSIIFVNSRRTAQDLTTRMKELNFAVEPMHSDMMQQERDAVMRDFKEGKHRVLIATDVVARGIDVQQVSLVINYDLPTNKENYIHRIGRSGRWGRKGVAINFVTREDVASLRELERFYATTIEEMPNDVVKLLTPA